MNLQQLQFVVVEGPIGVGKTSLARRLAKTVEAELLLEQPADNPFLERFYRDPKNAALPTQLYFLFQRARQLEQLKQSDLFQPRMIADFMLEKDAMFAQVTLDDDELRLYGQVYEKLALEAPRPDLVIYLQAPVNTLRERISGRGIGYEQLIKNDYLEKLSDAYTRFFYYYEGSPLLIVNAAEINPVDNDRHFEDLLDRIDSIQTGRHYFNPLAGPGR